MTRAMRLLAAFAAAALMATDGSAGCAPTGAPEMTPALFGSIKAAPGHKRVALVCAFKADGTVPARPAVAGDAAATFLRSCVAGAVQPPATAARAG